MKITKSRLIEIITEEAHSISSATSPEALEEQTEQQKFITALANDIRNIVARDFESRIQTMIEDHRGLMTNYEKLLSRVRNLEATSAGQFSDKDLELDDTVSDETAETPLTPEQEAEFRRKLPR
jgi:hypothetical protein